MASRRTCGLPRAQGSATAKGPVVTGSRGDSGGMGFSKISSSLLVWNRSHLE